MKKFFNKFEQFIKEEEGLTTVEYAVAGTLVALAVVLAFTQLGQQVGSSVDAIRTAIIPPGG